MDGPGQSPNGRGMSHGGARFGRPPELEERDHQRSEGEWLTEQGGSERRVALGFFEHLVLGAVPLPAGRPVTGPTAREKCRSAAGRPTGAKPSVLLCSCKSGYVHLSATAMGVIALTCNVVLCICQSGYVHLSAATLGGCLLSGLVSLIAGPSVCHLSSIHGCQSVSKEIGVGGGWGPG
jgi:hypothetical protein